MNKVTLRNSDIQVSRMGFGAWAVGGEWVFDNNQAGWGKVDDAESIQAIHSALDAGVNLIDTAANYGTGHSEEIVGKAIKDRRDQVVIATKFGFDVDEPAKSVAYYKNPADIIKNVAFECERSLGHLGIDAIDIYQFHMWDFPPAMVPDLMNELEKLVAQGKIRTYGWSTDDVKLARLFAAGEHAAVIQQASNVFQPSPEMFAMTAETGLTSLIRSPLVMGFLSEKYGKDAKFVKTDVRSHAFKPEDIANIVANRDKIREILTSNGRSTVQGALAWLWAVGEQVVPIPGIRTVAQAVENAAAMEFGPLTADQMAEIEQLLNRESVAS